MTHDPSPLEVLDTLPQIQLRVPGPWTSPQDLIEAMGRVTDEYELGNEIVIHRPTGRRFTWGASEHDDEIAAVFAGGGRIKPHEVEQIASHNVKIHVSAPGGSVEGMHAIMQLAARLIRAGGYGVMVDNSGATHNRQDWLDLAEGDDPVGGCYWACVAMTANDEECFSCGMHCLGLRDAEMPVPGNREAAGFLLHNFLGYIVQSGNPVMDGDRLGDEETSFYRVWSRPCTRFAQGTPFFNPYGVWSLEPDQGEPDDDEG